MSAGRPWPEVGDPLFSANLVQEQKSREKNCEFSEARHQNRLATAKTSGSYKIEMEMENTHFFLYLYLSL